jgi:hypothetical protein
MEQGLGSSTWWDEADYRRLGTVNDRALFILDKLIKRDIPKFQAAWAVAFPGRLMYEPRQIQPDEITRGPMASDLIPHGSSWTGEGRGACRTAPVRPQPRPLPIRRP